MGHENICFWLSTCMDHKNSMKLTKNVFHGPWITFLKNWKLNMYSVFNDIDEFMIMIDFLIRSSILYTYGFHRIFMTHEKDLVKKRTK